MFAYEVLGAMPQAEKVLVEDTVYCRLLAFTSDELNSVATRHLGSKGGQRLMKIDQLHALVVSHLQQSRLSGVELLSAPCSPPGCCALECEWCKTHFFCTPLGAK